MAKISFADVVSSSATFDGRDPAESLVLKLIDSPFFQRLRDVSQTANTRTVYMFSEHSRFGHCVGVAYIAKLLLAHLEERYASQVEPYRQAILAAALLHDIGHLAPGSHSAFEVWFPSQEDSHEQISQRIIQEDDHISALLKETDPAISKTVCEILSESPDLPGWTWQLISGGGWNVDRGNWCIADSVMAGVSYGQYNIPALIESIRISDAGELVMRENRRDAMMHFALSRHAMYRQIYQHRVILSVDKLTASIGKRARDLGDKLSFADGIMSKVLGASSPQELELDDIYCMREAWWRYHIVRWRDDPDPILSDLCTRLLDRDLLKTVRIRPNDDPEELMRQAQQIAAELGLDPTYYLHIVSSVSMHQGDLRQSMKMLMDDGRVLDFADVEPLFDAMARGSMESVKSWIAMPQAVKEKMERPR